MLQVDPTLRTGVVWDQLPVTRLRAGATEAIAHLHAGSFAGSDLQEVVGSAIALYILSSGACPLWAGVLVSAVLSFLMLLVERIGIRYLEAIIGVMIGCAQEVG